MNFVDGLLGLPLQRMHFVTKSKFAGISTAIGGMNVLVCTLSLDEMARPERDRPLAIRRLSNGAHA